MDTKSTLLLSQSEHSMDDTTEHGTSLWYKLFQLKQIKYKFNFELDTWERKSQVFIKLAHRFVVLADNVD